MNCPNCKSEEYVEREVHAESSFEKSKRNRELPEDLQVITGILSRFECAGRVTCGIQKIYRNLKTSLFVRVKGLKAVCFFEWCELPKL